MTLGTKSCPSHLGLMLAPLSDLAAAAGVSTKRLRPLATRPGTGRAALVDTAAVATRLGIDESSILAALHTTHAAALALRSAAQGLIDDS